MSETERWVLLYNLQDDCYHVDWYSHFMKWEEEGTSNAYQLLGIYNTQKEATEEGKKRREEGRLS